MDSSRLAYNVHKHFDDATAYRAYRKPLSLTDFEQLPWLENIFYKSWDHCTSRLYIHRFYILRILYASDTISKKLDPFTIELLGNVVADGSPAATERKVKSQKC